MSKPYEIICQLFNAQDETKLAEFLKTHDINASYDGENTVKLLAAKGEVSVVNLLLQKYGANVRSALYGYALAGNDDQVDALVQQYGAFPDKVASGYARGNCYQKVEEWIAKGATLDSAVEGYARNKDYKHVEEMLARGASIHRAVSAYARAGDTAAVQNLIMRGASPASAIFSYTLSGYTDEANQLRLYIELLGKLDPSQKIDEKRIKRAILIAHATCGQVEQVCALINEDNIKEAIFAFASGGHVNAVNELLSLPGADYADLHEAIKGYAMEGRVAEVEKLLQSDLAREESARFALYGFAFVGDKQQVNKLMAKYNELKGAENSVIYGYAKGGKTIELEEFLLSMPAIFSSYIKDAVRGYQDGGYLNNEKRILTLLSHIKDEDVRAHMIKGISAKTALYANADDLLYKFITLNEAKPSQRVSFKSYIERYPFFQNKKEIDIFAKYFNCKKLNEKIEKCTALLAQGMNDAEINRTLAHLLYEKSFYVEEADECNKLLKSALAHMATAISLVSSANEVNIFFVNPLRDEYRIVYSQWLSSCYRLGMEAHRHDYDDYVPFIKQEENSDARLLNFQITMRAMLDEYRMIVKDGDKQARVKMLKASYKNMLAHYVEELDACFGKSMAWKLYSVGHKKEFMKKNFEKNGMDVNAELINCSNLLFSQYMKGFFLYFAKGNHDEAEALFETLPHKKGIFEKCSRVLACIFGENKKEYDAALSLFCSIMKRKEVVAVLPISTFRPAPAPVAPKMDDSARDTLEERYGLRL